MGYSVLKSLESSRFKRVKRALIDEVKRGDLIAIAGPDALTEMFVTTIPGSTTDLIISNMVNVQAFLRLRFGQFTAAVVLEVNRKNNTLILHLKDEGPVSVTLVDNRLAMVKRVIEFGSSFISPTPVEEVTL